MTEDEWRRVEPAFTERASRRASMAAGYFNNLYGALVPEQLHEAVVRGLVIDVGRGVYRLAKAKPHRLEPLIAACVRLGAGAVVSHAAALAAHGLGPMPDVIDITISRTVERNAEREAGLVIHVDDLRHEEHGYVERIPATSRERTLRDCEAAGVSVQPVEPPKTPNVPSSGAVSDPELRVALNSTLVALSEVQRQLDSGRAHDWAAAHDEPDRVELPLTQLIWNEQSMLWGVRKGPVTSLEGLSAFATLEVLVLRESALQTLAVLPSLRAAELVVTATTDLRPLLSCAGLKRVRLRGARPDDPVIAALRERGVIVDDRAVQRLTAAPFEDPMLKLSVVEALHEAGEVELPELIVIDEDELDRENLERLLKVELPATALATLAHLYWEPGGHSLQHRVWPQFSGETDDFVIHSLVGHEALSGLQELSIRPVDAIPDEQRLALAQRGVTFGE